MTTTVLDSAVRVAPGREKFYAGMAAACLVVGVVGFTPTYWLPVATGTSNLSPLTHLHAAIFFGWLLFSLSQASLVASGRTMRHRELGIAGVSIATAMIGVGLAVAIQRVLTLEAVGQGESARRFVVIPVTAIAFFAVVVAVAIRNVNRPAVHKRLMVVATVSLLQAAVGRVVRMLAETRPDVAGLPPPPPSVAFSILPALLADLLIVVAMVHDKRTTGRVHRAYWIGGAALVAVQLLRVPLSGTDAWMRFTYWLTAFAR